MDIRNILEEQLPFFREKELKEAIAQKGQIVQVAGGSVILDEGKYVKTVPLLLSGLAKVVQVMDGKELLLYYIYPSESCIMSIHCGLNELKSTVRAIVEEDSVAVLLPAFEIGNWQRLYPSFNQFIIDLYQKRFHNVLEAFNALAFQKLDDRIMSQLNQRASALQSKEIHTTHQELSDELGTARETVSRILKKLEADQKLILHRGWIELL